MIPACAKRAVRIPQAFYQRDPLSPPFHLNLMLGLGSLFRCGCIATFAKEGPADNSRQPESDAGKPPRSILCSMSVQRLVNVVQWLFEEQRMWRGFVGLT
jgi:hypothetical protein